MSEAAWFAFAATGCLEDLARRVAAGQDVDATDPVSGRTALAIVVEQNVTVTRVCECVKALLASGASADVQDRHGRSALHAAARFGCRVCVAAMLAAGANPMVRDALGATPRDLTVHAAERLALCRAEEVWARWAGLRRLLITCRV